MPQSTLNANPEGHNQYTGRGSAGKKRDADRATDSAEYTSRQAAESPTRANHLEAETYHIRAATKHIAAGNMDQAVDHGMSAKHHREQAGLATNRDDVLNSNPEGHPVYEILTRNYSAPKSRKETLDGREYLVVPMTMIVPGVLNGSKGALFYPPEEVGKDPTPWNGMPITWYHPTRNGVNVSARDPDIIRDQGAGFLARSSANGKLRSEAWLDVAKVMTKPSGPEVLNKLRRGEPVEISTGLFTDNTEQVGEHNGKRYTHVARNYRPDHLAILPDQRGACSVDDGCGLMMNSNPEGHNQYTNHLSSATLGSASPGDTYTHPSSKKTYKISAVQEIIDGPNAGRMEVKHRLASGEHKTLGFFKRQQITNQEPVDNDWAEWNAKNLPTGEREFVMNQLALNSNPEGHNQYTGKTSYTHEDLTKIHAISGPGKGLMHDQIGSVLSGLKLKSKRVSDDAHSISSDPTQIGKHLEKNGWKKGETIKSPTGRAYLDKHQYGRGAVTLVLSGDSKGTTVTGSSSRGITQNMKESPMLTSNQREEIIESLIENSCGCWQAGDEPILSQFGDERLRDIAENNKEVVEALPWLANNAHVPPQFAKKKPKAEEAEEDDEELDDEKPPVKKEKKMTKNEEAGVTPVEKPKYTRDEVWNMLDQADREAITNAHDIVTKAKAELVTKLTANVRDETVKARLTTNLGTKSLDELKDLELLAPAPVQNKSAPPVLRPVFGPTGNSMTTDAVSNEEADISQMVSPRIDWAELSKANDSRNRTVHAN